MYVRVTRAVISVKLILNHCWSKADVFSFSFRPTYQTLNRLRTRQYTREEMHRCIVRQKEILSQESSGGETTVIRLEHVITNVESTQLLISTMAVHCHCIMWNEIKCPLIFALPSTALNQPSPSESFSTFYVSIKFNREKSQMSIFNFPLQSLQTSQLDPTTLIRSRKEMYCKLNVLLNHFHCRWAIGSRRLNSTIVTSSYRKFS